MKKLLTILCICTTILCHAQNKKNEAYLQKRALKFTEEITNYIPSISAEQKTKLIAINYTVSTQFDSIKNANLESVDYKKASRQIFVQRDVAIKKILTVVQYDDYLLMQEEKKQEYFKKKKKELKTSTEPDKPSIVDSLIKK